MLDIWERRADSPRCSGRSVTACQGVGMSGPRRTGQRCRRSRKREGICGRPQQEGRVVPGQCWEGTFANPGLDSPFPLVGPGSPYPCPTKICAQRIWKLVYSKMWAAGTSLVVKSPLQGVQVWSLVREQDPTCLVMHTTSPPPPPNS